ncbi:MAG: VacJ family lipoprotein [Rhodospirillales bacterium]|nr:VacJ family lipoprotein [Rhodospirillales bacterium]MCW8862099.1 VacJ family lipoprotein [Rhodospirillales bacterium]MCW8971286.1 VacJ family lipoprotein [Rhodospirillales bacterium]MCW9002161.1 VacJ family lipoprotein [Rhodospirillales bacterium]
MKILAVFFAAFVFSAPFATVGHASGQVSPQAPQEMYLAAADQTQEAQANDPLEGLNRGLFWVYQLVDTWFIEPAAIFYKDVLPPIIQNGIRNVLNNLRSPVVFANDLLQGDIDRAGVTLKRFVINSTVGIAGLRDQAGEWGIYRHSEDFGQTLAIWGMPEGPFIMLPVIGPTNPRDIVGLVVDFLADPLNRWADNTHREWITYSRSSGTATELRAANYDSLQEMERTSLDYYATLRSLYRQHRAHEIKNGKTNGPMPAPGLSQRNSAPETAERMDRVSADR